MISKWAIFVLLAVISAHPFSKNFGDRVRRALVENGTNYNETAKSVTSKRHGDATWTSCGNFTVIHKSFTQLHDNSCSIRS